MVISINPRQVNEIRQVLDQFLRDYNVPDEFFLGSRRSREEFSRIEFTHALTGEHPMTIFFSRGNILAIEFIASRREEEAIEFLRILNSNGNYDIQLSQKLNNIFTIIIHNRLPSLERVLENLRLKRRIEEFPHFRAFSPQFDPVCYGGGSDRQLTEDFLSFVNGGNVELQRFRIVCQWGNSLRVDLIKIEHPKNGHASFLAVEGIIL